MDQLMKGRRRRVAVAAPAVEGAVALTVGRGRRACAALFAVGLVGLVSLIPSAAQAAGAPEIAFDPQSYDYGTIDSGTTASKTYTLTNSGGTATRALTVSLPDPSAFSKTADTCTGTSLGPNKSCSVTVQYAPASAGASDSATLAAKSKRPTATATAALSAKSSTPASADISLAYSGDPWHLLTVTNNGPAAATVTVRVAPKDQVGCWVRWRDYDLTGLWSKPPTAVGCGYDFTSLQPIASGSSLSITLEAMIPDGHAEVWASSLPDPDSTPGNGQAAEDDYVSIPYFVWD